MKKICAFIFLSILFSACNSNNSKNKSIRDELEREAKVEAELDSIRKNDKKKAMLGSDWIDHTWNYVVKTDEMSDAQNVWAKALSDNFIKDYPYDDIYALIVIRYMKGNGSDAYIQITAGQIYGNEYRGENYIMARFDDGNAIKYDFNDSPDGSTKYIFIKKSKDFIKRCNTAKSIKIQIPLYQKDRPIFSFSFDKYLNWQEKM